MKRRVFIKVVGGVAGGLAVGGQSLLSAAEATSNATETRVEGLPRRPLGQTGRKISVVGFPGLALMHYDQNKCTEGLHSAFERGLNYFDVAPAYNNGDCEIKMGIGLQGLDRDQYFLACKTNRRDKEGARKELERSLTRLKTDHFDLYQLHHLRQPAEVREVLGPNGALETIQKARDEGKIRHVGFSAHTTKAALMVMKEFRFDTIMFPVSFAEYYTVGFAKEVLEYAEKQGVGVIAIKPLSMGQYPQGMKKSREWWYRTTESQREVDMAMRFSLSQPGVVSGIPPSFLDLLDKAIEAGKNYKPITTGELAELQEIAKSCESYFKTEDAKVVAMGGSRHERTMGECPHDYGHYA